MNKFLKQISFFALPIVAGIIMLFSVNPDKHYSYRFVEGECNNKASWIHDRIFLSDKKLDVVFIGASQTACAVKDALIESQISEFSHEKIHVASLGYCRGGRDIQYVMLKEVFRYKKPEVVVIEVTEDEPKKSHPVFPYLADTNDLFESAVFLNQRYLQALWKGLVIRFEYIRGSIFSLNLSAGDSAADYGYIPTNAVADSSLLIRNRINWEQRLNRNKSKLLRNIELRYSKHYLDKMIDLVQKNGSNVIFLYLRESGSNLSKPLLFDYYSSVSDIILLPEFIFSNPDNWSDATHLNDEGATLASEKIAQELAARILNK